MSPAGRAHALVVVGAGPAGMACAIESQRLGIEPLLLDRSGRGGGLLPIIHELSNWPGTSAREPGAALAARFRRSLRSWGIAVRKADVVRVRPRARELVLDCADGTSLRALRVALATGTAARVPAAWSSIPALTGRVAVSGREAWSRHWRSRVAVVGASDVAFDQARWLCSRGLDVRLLCRSPSPRAPAWLVDAARREGVRVCAEANLRDAHRAAEGVELELDCGPRRTRLRVDGVLCAAGREPSLVTGAAPLKAGPQACCLLAGDCTGRPDRFVAVAMCDGILVARRLLGNAALGPGRAGL
jgi:thioredoxin reductase